MSAPHRLRPRRPLLLTLGLVVSAGLASRAWPLLLPAGLGKYPGDALWGGMILAGLALLRPGMPPGRLAWLALAFCGGVEASQLYQAPWINALRATGWGHLVLGSAFHWPDLAAYATGILAGHLADRAFWPRRLT